MIRTKSKMILLFMTASILTGCIRNIDIPYPDYKPQKVLMGTLEPNKPISIRLSNTLPVTSTDTVYPPITNAKVLCFEDGILLGELSHQKDGIYSLEKTPKSKSIYKIQASIDSEMITATDTMPSPINFSVELTKDNLQNVNYNPDFKLEIQRESKSYNWFSITYYRASPPVIVRPQPFFSESVYLDLFNSSKSLNGKTLHGFNIRIKPEYIGKLAIEGVPGNQFNKDSSLYVQFLDVSYSYDRYLKTAIVAWENRVSNNEGGLNNPFYEPVTIYSNVTGGIGILGSVQTRLVVVKRPK
ncbi:DUF4249 family protein [Runella aurantiaca]|uniref:DUF4249 family protein n=2 Tax=Runella aurantiaca TaxID=2282308 RepID=A0A369I767_9BACT|nr:DUF4249 family protein [Runella aurantiaca]